MIRPLTENDRAATVALLATAPDFNLYLLGNIASLGLTASFSQFWGDFCEDGHHDNANGTGALRGVLNRYMTGWAVFGRADADWAGMARILDAHPEGADRLQDNPGGIDSFMPYVQNYQATHVSVEELMNLAEADFVPCEAPHGITVRCGVIDDLGALTDFYADAGHMRRTPPAVEQPLRRTRLWLAERDGTILSAALTNAETTERAMIGGVYTPPEHRGQGLSKAVCSALCADLLADDKRPVLYWETPAAGAVYRKLGFRVIGSWRALRLAARK